MEIQDVINNIDDVTNEEKQLLNFIRAQRSEFDTKVMVAIKKGEITYWKRLDTHRPKSAK